MICGTLELPFNTILPQQISQGIGPDFIGIYLLILAIAGETPAVAGCDIKIAGFAFEA